MAALGRYIFSVTTASVVFTVLLSLLDKKSCAAMLVRLIGCLFIMFTAIAPVAEIDVDSILEITSEYTSQGNAIAASGQDITEKQLHQIIKQKCETYIYDKAMSYQTPMDVEVTLSESHYPIPIAVVMKGRISPHVKSSFSIWLQEEIGIPKENQIWSE